MGEPVRVVDEIPRYVHRLLPEAADVTVVSPLRLGRSYGSWVVGSSLGRLTVKVSNGVANGVSAARLAEHARLWRAGVAVPQLLAWGDVDGRLVAVMEHLPGRDAADVVQARGGGGMADAMHTAGSALARLHKVHVDGFGDPATGLGVGPSRWSDVVRSRSEGLRVTYAGLDGGVRALADGGLHLLDALADALPDDVSAAPAHLDLYLPNILLDDIGAFRALLDLEHVRWVDPVMDFVKPVMWIFDRWLAWAEPFVDGYRSAAGWPQAWSIRAAVATGLELMTGVPYWLEVGDDSMCEDYQRRLDRWLRSGGEDHAWSDLIP